MTQQRKKGHSVRVHGADLVFLKTEQARLTRERFLKSRIMPRLNLADVVDRLIRELKTFRKASGECECGALRNETEG